jgi:hypothetical protein
VLNADGAEEEEQFDEDEEDTEKEVTDDLIFDHIDSQRQTHL